jgi:hypothetical protein
MWQFLQTYGIWILFGILIVLMMRMHGRGMHGGGMHGHDQRDEPSNTQRVVPLRDSNTDTQRAMPLEGENTRRGTLVRDVSAEEGNTDAERYQEAPRRRSGC